MKFDRNEDGKVDKNDFFTGEKDKTLLVHVMQDNIEVSKPIKTQIWKQQVEWKQRIFPISHEDFIIDSKGIHHIYVEANTLNTKRFNNHNGKVIDARNARDLLKRKTIEAIWGIDSTHIILLIVIGIGLLIAMAFAMVMYQQNTNLQSKINAAIATGNTKLLLDEQPAPAPSGTVVTR